MTKLTVVATPIGNLGDLSPRAKEALATADVLACEDTRTTKKLMSLEGIESAARTLAYHEYNEQQAAPGLIKLIQEGKKVVLVSDAGLPGTCTHKLATRQSVRIAQARRRLGHQFEWHGQGGDLAIDLSWASKAAIR